MRLQPNEMANAIWEQERGGSVADGLGWPTDDLDDWSDELRDFYSADNENHRREVRRAG